MTTEVVKELTVGRYEFFKEKGRSDVSIAKQYDMDQNQLNKWKKEKGLIGKDYGLRGRKAATIKTVSIQDEEVKPLKENDIPEERLKDSYSPNKKLQEKLAEKKQEAKGWERVKELTESMSQEKKAEVLAAYDQSEIEETVKPSSIEETQINVGKSETFDKAFNEAMESEQSISYKEQLENLQKEKALLEEKLQAVEQEKQAEVLRKLMLEVVYDVKDERRRQNGLWGVQRHNHYKWLAILTEELGEVAQSLQTSESWSKGSDAQDTYKELVQVAAVSIAWAEQILEKQELERKIEKEAGQDG